MPDRSDEDLKHLQRGKNGEDRKAKLLRVTGSKNEQDEALLRALMAERINLQHYV